MTQPSDGDQNASPSNETAITIVLVFLGAGLLLLITLLAFLLRDYVQPQLTQAPAISTPTPISNIPSTSVPPIVIAASEAVPTSSISTSDCGSPSLTLGSITFQIQPINPAPDGSFAVPPYSSGVAYWVQGTDRHPVFILSPIFENLTLLTTLTAGSTATTRWGNCSSTTSTLDAPVPGSLDVSSLPDPSSDGITLFFQTDSIGNGFVMGGSLTGTQPSANIVSSPVVENTLPLVAENTQPPAAQIIASPVVIDTPVRETSDVQAEISLLDTTTSPNGTTISISISIYNWGQSAFTLSTNAVSLTQPDGTPLAMISSEPTLPKSIVPTATETFNLTFSRPASQTATLKVFTVEYDIDGY